MEEVAREFCYRNDLGPDIEVKILGYIKSNMPIPEPVKNTEPEAKNQEDKFKKDNSKKSTKESNNESLRNFSKIIVLMR